MSRILYRAKSADGREVADFVEAPSAAEAMRVLRASGLREVVLLQSPAEAAFNPTFATISSQQFARLQADMLDKPGLATALRGLARLNAGILLVGTIILLGAAWLRLPVIAVAGAAWALFPFAIHFWMRRHLRHYLAFHVAYTHGRWAKAQRIARRLEGTGESLLAPFDVAVRLACIRAKQGQADPALATLEAWQPRLADKAPGIYEARIASVQFAAGRYDEYLQQVEQAAERSGQDPSRQVGMALAHARFGDPGHAGQLLASIQTELLPPVAHQLFALATGIAHLRGGQLALAVADLRAVADAFRNASKHTPTAVVAQATATGYLALALARTGQRAQAQVVIAPLLPLLRLHAEKPLLDMLQAEVPQPAA